MQIKVFDSHHEMSRASAAVMLDCIHEEPSGLYCFAAGHTQSETLRLFTEAATEKSLDLGRARWISLDEWVGFGKGDAGSCYDFVSRNLFEPLCIERDRFFFFDGLSKDTEEQCLAADRYIDAHGPIACAVLGVGLNGHLGFNEPGSDINSRSFVVRLAETSVRVSGKYFGKQVDVECGITLGMADLFAAGRLIIQCTGAHKAEIVKRMLTGEPSADIPASLVRNLSNCEVFLDSESAAELPGLSPGVVRYGC